MTQFRAILSLVGASASLPPALPLPRQPDFEMPSSRGRPETHTRTRAHTPGEGEALRAPPPRPGPAAPPLKSQGLSLHWDPRLGHVTKGLKSACMTGLAPTAPGPRAAPGAARGARGEGGCPRMKGRGSLHKLGPHTGKSRLWSSAAKPQAQSSWLRL